MEAKRGFRLSNRLNYTILAVIIIIALGIGVYAYGTNNPSNFGHSAGEIDGVCKSDGSGCPSDLGGISGLEYLNDARSSCSSGSAINIDCSSGKVVLGGGCAVSGGGAVLEQTHHTNYHSSSDTYRGWHCKWQGSPSVCGAYVICADAP